jgi:effector-binding domain-containing protein
MLVRPHGREPQRGVQSAYSKSSIIAPVTGEVRAEHVGPRVLAGIRTSTSRPELGSKIVRTLDRIWPALRAAGVRTGHNVVIYRGGNARDLEIEVGVETFTEFGDLGEIRRVLTPTGEVATTAHFGDYSEMGPAYAAMERWCASHARRATGISWEVYGDWEDDPRKRRTDLFFLLEPLTSSSAPEERSS